MPIHFLAFTVVTVQSTGHGSAAYLSMLHHQGLVARPRWWCLISASIYQVRGRNE